LSSTIELASFKITYFLQKLHNIKGSYFVVLLKEDQKLSYGVGANSNGASSLVRHARGLSGSSGTV
jgi:hypothetical protein